ncbi:hypothetical protein [Fodinicola acaciae]|uniref:hypothetical protein n=1 Tax=Fodinicola acaciae TaxID=2681555 RepID=UPI0013D258EE
MTAPGLQDPFCYPGTRTLRNLLDERDPAVLTQIETELTRVAMIRLDRQPLAGNFDLAHLCAIHKRIFGKVYPWAGQVRTVEIA